MNVIRTGRGEGVAMGAGGQLRLFGATEIFDGRQVHPVREPKLRALLALLAVSGASGATVPNLVAELGRPPGATAERTLRAYLYKLRQQLAIVGWADRLVTTPSGYAARLDAGSLDTLGFTELAERGLRNLRDGDVDVARRRLRAAVGLWHADPFADVIPGPLIRAHAYRLEELRALAALGWIDAEMLCGRHQEVLSPLRAMAGARPTHEGISARLMVSLRRCGQHGAAQAEYRRISGRLDEELGLAPSARLRRLGERIRDPEGHLDWQLLRSDHRDEDTGGGVLTLRAPGRTTILSGRDGDVDALVARLSGTGRTVALSGPPGVGKTALALEVARRVVDRFPDGQVVVDLQGHAEPARSPDVVLRWLLDALGAPTAGAGTSELLATFRTWTARRRLLLVLDDAADSAQVRGLLPTGPHCTVLITSTEQLRGLPGVWTWPVEPLSPAAAGAALARLMGERWTADRAAVGRVTALCDGSPLALTVATQLAQARGLSAEQLARLLADDAARLRLLYGQDTLIPARTQASWRRLDPEARSLWRRLSGLEPVLTDAAVHGGEPVTPFAGHLLQASILRELPPENDGARRFRLADAARLYGRTGPGPADAAPPG